MSTPRAQSVKLSFSNTTEPIRQPVAPGFSAETKIDHYAYVGRLIRSGMELFFSDQSMLTYLSSLRSTSELHHSLEDRLFASMEYCLSTPGLHDTTNAIRVSDGDHGEGYHFALEDSIQAGIGTYIFSTDGVYTALRQEFGIESAQHPNNASILDRVSKLNVDHMGPYTNVFLDANSYTDRPQNRTAFIDQLEPARGGGWRFKAGFPEAAFIPVESAKRKLMWSNDDFTIKGNEGLQLKDVPAHSATVGCPFSFNPEDGRRLWSLYASARHAIEQRGVLATTAISGLGDSAGSGPTTS